MLCLLSTELSLEYHDSLLFSELRLDCRSIPYTFSLEFCIVILESLVEFPLRSKIIFLILFILLRFFRTFLANLIINHLRL